MARARGHESMSTDRSRRIRSSSRSIRALHAGRPFFWLNGRGYVQEAAGERCGATKTAMLPSSREAILFVIGFSTMGVLLDEAAKLCPPTSPDLPDRRESRQAGSTFQLRNQVWSVEMADAVRRPAPATPPAAVPGGQLSSHRKSIPCSMIFSTAS